MTSPLCVCGVTRRFHAAGKCKAAEALRAAEQGYGARFVKKAFSPVTKQ